MFRSQFEKLGVEIVRASLTQGHYKGNWPLHNAAVAWLGEKDAEAHLRAEAARAEELELARSTRDAARDANALASSANDLAREANSIARDASASAARSADAARTNNKIAIAALIAAIIAIAISVWSITHGS